MEFMENFVSRRLPPRWLLRQTAHYANSNSHNHF